MKFLNYKISGLFLNAVLLLMVLSCNDFLDREPQSSVLPEDYFNTTESLVTYVDGKYVYFLPNHGYSNITGYNYGIFQHDAGTDNQVGSKPPNQFVDLFTVGSGSGEWNFERIYEANWFIEQVEDKLLKGQIIGDQNKAKHYLGEMYFLRAYEYFNRLQKIGDFPIITQTLPDNRELLIDASKRKPRNEVARFILSDLDKAAELMSHVDLGSTRISRPVAFLLKSRVALYEATWLKYFKNTPFVPLGDGWPGYTKEYSKNYVFPSGTIDSEIEYFLDQTMVAAYEVADISHLTENTGIVPQILGESNPYLEMFGSVDLNVFNEVMLWMPYAKDLTTHGAVYYAQTNNNGVGLTRGLVDSYLMKNGLPIYSSSSGYLGDDSFANVRANRDYRLAVFLKEPGQKNWLNPDVKQGGDGIEIELVPRIDKSMSSTMDAYRTGYSMRKGNSTDKAQSLNNGSYTGCVVFRQAEVLLNYIEACYEKNGSLDAAAITYWEALRQRSGITASIETTINATNMNIEAKNDWGAFSAGQIVSPTLYNIRRERRCEFIGDGLRYMDLCRWRAMDQMITTPYVVEGIHIYDPTMRSYLEAHGVQYVSSGSRATVSSESDGEYFQVFRIGGNAEMAGYNGLSWRMAHYLTPIGADEFLQTTNDGRTISDSPIYQNPYWKTDAGSFPEK